MVLATVVEGNGVTLIESRAEDLVHPVGAVGGHPGVLGGIPTHGQRKTGVGIGELAHLNFLLGVEGSDHVGSGTYTGYHVVLDVDTLVGFLGGYQDNTAGTGGGSVDGGGGGILQDDDALDVVHGRDGGAGNAVNYPQHGFAIGVAGTLTTDDDAGRCIRRAAVGGNHHTGNLALQHAFRGGYRTGGQGVGIVHDTHGGTQVLLPGLGTVTQGHGFLKHLDIFLEDDVNLGASVHGNLLGSITQAGDFENRIGRNIDGIGTIKIRDCIGVTGEHHGARNGAHGITHGSTHCQVLCLRTERHSQTQKCGCETEQFFGNHSC